MSARLLRLTELLLLLAVAILPPLLSSTFWLLGHGVQESGAASYSDTYLIMHELTSLALLAYILLRQGRSWADIGMRFRWSDLAHSGGVLVCAYGVHSAAAYLWNSIGASGSATDSVAAIAESPGDSYAVLCSIVLVLVNPVFEESIVRGFFMTDVRTFTGSPVLAVVLSTLLQTSYHFYQGIVPTLLLIPLFFVFSLYFVVSRRCIPLILAHLCLNALRFVS